MRGPTGDSDIVIVGAGGFAREVHTWLPDVYPADKHQFKGFLGRDDSIVPGTILGDPLGYSPEPDERFILAIGDIEVRKKVCETLREKRAEFIHFVHPTSLIAPSATIGIGAVIYPFAVVSNQATLGDFAHLSLHASVGHDAVTGANCYLAPYSTLNGVSRIGDDVLVASHATVASGVSVGNRSKVAANSSAMHDAHDDSIIFGVPGRRASRVECEGST